MLSGIGMNAPECWPEGVVVGDAIGERQAQVLTQPRFSVPLCPLRRLLVAVSAAQHGAEGNHQKVRQWMKFGAVNARIGNGGKALAQQAGKGKHTGRLSPAVICFLIINIQQESR